MKLSYILAAVASTTMFFSGMSFLRAEQPTLSKPTTQMCSGGGYPILICEIINGRKVCRRECP